MRRKAGVVTQLVLAGAAALAWCTGAQAALFVTYGGSGTNAPSLQATSDALDLGGLFSSFTVSATLGLTVSSLKSSTVTAAGEGLQVLQGCPLAAGSCTPGDWTDIVGHGTSLGGPSFAHMTLPTETKSFATGSVLVTGVSVESLRLKFDASKIDPPASVGVTGTLSVTQVPEPATWAMLIAGTALVVGIARRRLG
jgi:hypothetical protein